MPSPVLDHDRKQALRVLEEPAVIEKILKHIRLDPQPPPPETARRVELFHAA